MRVHVSMLDGWEVRLSAIVPSPFLSILDSNVEIYQIDGILSTCKGRSYKFRHSTLNETLMGRRMNWGGRVQQADCFPCLLRRHLELSCLDILEPICMWFGDWNEVHFKVWEAKRLVGSWCSDWRSLQTLLLYILKWWLKLIFNGSYIGDKSVPISSTL